MLEDKLMNINKPKLSELLKSLDTYSLGLLPLILILDISDVLITDHLLLFRLLRLPELTEPLNLLRDMTAFNYKDRLSPVEAQKRYYNILSKLG